MRKILISISLLIGIPLMPVGCGGFEELDDANTDNDSFTETNGTEDTDANADADSDAEGDADADSDANADTRSVASTDAEAEANTDDTADSESNADADSGPGTPIDSVGNGNTGGNSEKDDYSTSTDTDKTKPGTENPDDSDTPSFELRDSDSDSDSDGDAAGDTNSETGRDSSSDFTETAATDSEAGADLPIHCSRPPTSDPELACQNWIACCGWEPFGEFDTNYWYDGQSCEARHRIELSSYSEEQEHEYNCRYNAQLVRCENLGTDAAQCTCETVQPGTCEPTTDDPNLACTAAYECCNFISPFLDSDPTYAPINLTVGDDSCEWYNLPGDAFWHNINCINLGTPDAFCRCEWAPNCD